MQPIILKPQRILAVSSGGGHWIEMLRLRPAFTGHDVQFVSVNESYAQDIDGAPYTTIRDATRENPLALVVIAWQLLKIVWRCKPDVVISTGAAPGFMALGIGKLFGARTIWLDSIANVDELSGSGRHARRIADLWLTQWEHLASSDGPRYQGKVL